MTTKALSKELRRSLERHTLQYSRNIRSAEEWLKGRGISLAVADSYGLGVVDSPPPGYDGLYGRLSIPYLTDAGPVNMTFRCMKDHGGEKCKAFGHEKYYTWKGLETNLYGVQCVDWADDWIVLCEGELDALTWQMAGVPALGFSGVKKWRNHWKLNFEDFSTIYVASDADKAGDEMWKSVSDRIPFSKRLRYPDGEDANSTFVKYGPEVLRDMIKA